MSEKPNHWCKICGVGYYACNDCDKQQNWRAYACSVEHYQLYNILSFYNLGYASKEETIKGLKSLGVTTEQAMTFIKGVREKTLEILEEPKLEPIVDIVEPVLEDTITEIKPVMKSFKKKNTKEKGEE